MNHKLFLAKFFLQLSILTLFALTLFACTHYIEQPTPPGQVALPVEPAQAQPYRTTNEPEQPYRFQSATQPPNPKAPQAVQFKPMFSASITHKFKKVYSRIGSPRLAVFFNRALSDEVREWRTTERFAVTTSGKVTYETKKGKGKINGTGGLSAYHQTHLENPNRNPMGESWMWRFEDGFLAPLLEVSTKVVDRATIMRLTASASNQQGSAHDLMAVKKIEMDSLTGKADYLVEILVRRAPHSKLGYEFKASAKEVTTGIIRAHVTTINWDYGPQMKKPEKVIATDKGYQFKTEAPKLPDVHVVARDLALSLMDSLVANWQQL
ncbi:hypothetical protein QUF90_12255 [Desulfococcaceae bacterium HSG9]|nr:hypothetical protein [Desulfococcaceae bacterium HSG9]